MVNKEMKLVLKDIKSLLVAIESNTYESTVDRTPYVPIQYISEEIEHILRSLIKMSGQPWE